MKSDVRTLLNSLAKTLIKYDFDGANKYLSKWLDESSISQLDEAIHSQISKMKKMFEDEVIGSADSFELEDTFMKADELREDGVELVKEITNENFVSWCCISIQADKGEWSLYDLWCAVVRVDDQLQIGYFEIEHPD